MTEQCKKNSGKEQSVDLSSAIQFGPQHSRSSRQQSSVNCKARWRQLKMQPQQSIPINREWIFLCCQKLHCDFEEGALEELAVGQHLIIRDALQFAAAEIYDTTNFT